MQQHFIFSLQASTEVEKRCKRLDDMCDDLEDFYLKLQDLDHWLDEAIEKTGDLKGNKDGVDLQFTVFKVIYENWFLL